MLAALRAAERAFGADVNSKGYRVPRGVGVIQVSGCGRHTPTGGQQEPEE